MSKKKSVLLCVPFYGTGINPTFFQAWTIFLQDADKLKYPLGINIQAGDSLISRQRNNMAKQFLDLPEYDVLLWLDSDLVFSVDHINKIMDDMSLPGVDMCCGLYPKKDPKVVDWVINILDEPLLAEKRDDHLQHIKFGGTGFLAISRKVFESIQEKYGNELRYNEDGSGKEKYDFFKVGCYKYPNGTTRYLSEDWYFGQMAIDCGFKTYLDATLVLKHAGTCVFPLPHQEKQILDSMVNINDSVVC